MINFLAVSRYFTFGRHFQYRNENLQRDCGSICYFISVRRKQSPDDTRNLKRGLHLCYFRMTRMLPLYYRESASHKQLIYTLPPAPVFETKILTHNVALTSKERKLLCRLQSQYESFFGRKKGLCRDRTHKLTIFHGFYSPFGPWHLIMSFMNILQTVGPLDE
jgi:hypothetical protein